MKAGASAGCAAALGHRRRHQAGGMKAGARGASGSAEPGAGCLGKAVRRAGRLRERERLRGDRGRLEGRDLTGGTGLAVG